MFIYLDVVRCFLWPKIRIHFFGWLWWCALVTKNPSKAGFIPTGSNHKDIYSWVIFPMRASEWPRIPEALLEAKFAAFWRARTTLQAW